MPSPGHRPTFLHYERPRGPSGPFWEGRAEVCSVAAGLSPPGGGCPPGQEPSGRSAVAPNTHWPVVVPDSSQQPTPLLGRVMDFGFRRDHTSPRVSGFLNVPPQLVFCKSTWQKQAEGGQCEDRPGPWHSVTILAFQKCQRAPCRLPALRRPLWPLIQFSPCSLPYRLKDARETQAMRAAHCGPH